jgi:hypothetical protein
MSCLHAIDLQKKQQLVIVEDAIFLPVAAPWRMHRQNRPIETSRNGADV